MSSNLFNFELPRLPESNSVESLSFDEYFHGVLKDQVLPNFPPRTLEQLIGLVDEGKSDTISILEWLDIIENEYHWSGLNPSQEREACRALWMVICTSSTLGSIAFFKAALAAQGMPSSMVKPLLDSMAIVRNVQGLHPNCAQKIDWITAIQTQDYATLAQACYDVKASPRKRIKQLMLPNANSYGEHIVPYLADCTASVPTKNEQVWLESCFEELKTTTQRAVFCEQILLTYGNTLKPGILMSLLEEQCLPSSEHSLWYQLSDKALQELKSLFDLTSFSELQAITNKLLSRSCVDSLAIPEEQRNQLRGRTQFWSNYSEKFDRLRAILPSETKSLLEDNGLRFSEQISVFKQQKDNNVEVFIFGLEKLIVVEVLRGPISESRFYKNNQWNSKRLFDKEFNSLDELRELAQIEVHDHVFLWQYYCERLLRTQFKIMPNASLVSFAGLSGAKSRYSHANGLAKPALDRIEERKAKLEIWLENFWRCEFATTKYGKDSLKESEGTQLLIKAQVHQQLGDSEKEQYYLKQASESGNTEAKYRYGTSLIKGDAQARKEGERHMLESAKKGHKSAEEFIKKFGISEYAQKRPIFKKHLISLNTSSKIWIGFHREKGWVELDRNLFQNRPESKDEMIFINMSKGEMFFEEKRNWKEPLFIFAPKYIDFASDKQLQELETIFIRYNIKIK
ncbi:TPA: EH signature domain-containing protein [Vibrio vulnificus]